MRRYSIWYDTREDCDPSFEQLPPLWSEFRPLTWGIISAVWASAFFASWHISGWIHTTARTIEAIEQDQQAVRQQFRNNPTASSVWVPL